MAAPHDPHAALGALHERAELLDRPGVITLTRPKVPEAKIRGSQKGFQWVILGLKRVSGVLKGVRRGPMGPPGPLELSALSTTRASRMLRAPFPNLLVKGP